MAEEQIGDDVQVFAQRQVLEHGGDAHAERHARVLQRYPAAEIFDRAGRGLVDAGEDVDEGRLARAVVSHERDDLSGMDVELDVGKRRHRAEALGDSAEAQNGFGRWRLGHDGDSSHPQVDGSVCPARQAGRGRF
jgi:hypothetical protein